MAATLSLIEHPTDADTRPILDGLIAFNAKAAPPQPQTPLCLHAHDDAGRLIGGLVGFTHFDWLYIDMLWLEEDSRHQGTGQSLLEAAEAEALRRGCRRAWLYTFSFQAPGFYERNGYTCWGALEGYPPGHSQMWYRKDLTE